MNAASSWATGSAICVVGSQGCRAALEPDARPDRALLYSRAADPCLSFAAPRASPTHCERSGARSKSWAPVRPISMPLDVLSLQSFYGSPLGGVARRLIGRVIRERWEQQRRPLDRRGRLRRALSRTIPRRRSPMPGLDARRTGRRDLAGSRALRRSARRSRKCCRCLTAPSTGCCSPTPWRRPTGRTRCWRNCGASPRLRDE